MANAVDVKSAIKRFETLCHSSMTLNILFCLASSVVVSTQCGIHLPKHATGITSQHQISIFDGNIAPAGKWPWQIVMGINDRQGCGGTVISERWILTAKHCARRIRDISKVIVYSGISTFNQTKTGEKIHTSKVIEIRIHGELAKKFLGDDIALLKLEIPFVFDDNVSSICLPNPNQLIPDAAHAVVTGFGTANYPGTTITFNDGQLREVVVPIINKATCKKLWTSKMPNLNWTSVICAGWAGHGTGKGDSGGPLMMKATDGRWFQIGITSFGNGEYDFEGKLPNAFTDIRPYCDWIKNMTGNEASCEEEVKF